MADATDTVKFRSMQRITRIFARLAGIANVCNTGIILRIRKIVSDPESHEGKSGDCAIDFTGFKIMIREYYLGIKRNRKRRGWSKIHAVTSVNDVSVMSFAITDDHLLDPRKGEKTWRILGSELRDYSATSSVIQRLFRIRLRSDNKSMEKHLYRWRVKGGGVFNLVQFQR